MSRYVDLPTVGTSIGLCVVLPGREYTADRPLLSFAARTAMAHGWAVRQVWWDPPARGSKSVEEESEWVQGELAAATNGCDSPVLVVGKSLGTLAAVAAAERGYPAVWLTPLLTEPIVAHCLLGYPARQFTMIGSEDPYLDEAVFDALPGERLLVAGDHVLAVPGNPVAMAVSHERFVRSLDAWLGTIAQM